MSFTTHYKEAVAVYCGSSIGTERAYSRAARSVGHALAHANRPLVYGGGSHGLMGVVSGAVIEYGGEVTGIVPYAIHVGGGEPDKASNFDPQKEAVASNSNTDHGKIETIIVNSMHERKVEMAERSGGFIGLPGGFGTFEEVLEVTTWTQLGIHSKRLSLTTDDKANDRLLYLAVVLLNVLGFYEPLRQLVQNGVKRGFIQESNMELIIFIDGPTSYGEHEDYNWGDAALSAIESWQRKGTSRLNWTERVDGTVVERGTLGST